MSKYIKLEDAIHNINLEVTGRKEYTGDMKANLFFALDELPTISVSEDCISRADLLKEMLEEFGSTHAHDKTINAIYGMVINAPSVVPNGERIEE